MIRILDFSFVKFHVAAKGELWLVTKKSEQLDIFAQLAVIELHQALPMATRDCGPPVSNVRFRSVRVGRWELFLSEDDDAVELLMVRLALEHFDVIEQARERFLRSLSKPS